MLSHCLLGLKSRHETKLLLPELALRVEHDEAFNSRPCDELEARVVDPHEAVDDEKDLG